MSTNEPRPNRSAALAELLMLGTAVLPSAALASAANQDPIIEVIERFAVAWNTFIEAEEFSARLHARYVEPMIDRETRHRSKIPRVELEYMRAVEAVDIAESPYGPAYEAMNAAFEALRAVAAELASTRPATAAGIAAARALLADRGGCESWREVIDTAAFVRGLAAAAQDVMKRP